MPNGSPTQERSFYLQHVLKDSIGGRKPGFEPMPGEPSAATIARDCGVASSASSEVDPNGLAAKVPGSKMDSGKVDSYRGAVSYFPRAIEAIARVSEAGARKYSWKGWEKVANGFARYSAAMMRHIMKEDREEIDQDTGEPHLAETAWNAMARLELYLRDKEQTKAANEGR
jgi:Domain of unknown function (DUF5664)